MDYLKSTKDCFKNAKYNFKSAKVGRVFGLDLTRF
jgi:hypothetical protein